MESGVPDMMSGGVPDMMSGGQSGVPNGQSGQVTDPLGADPSTEAQSGMPTVACFSCGRVGHVAKVTKNLRCVCGSENVVVDDFDTTYDLPESWAPQKDSMDPNMPDVVIRFSTGIVGYVYQNPGQDQGDWQWKLIRKGEVIDQGWSYTKDQAQRSVEAEEPLYAISPSIAKKVTMQKHDPATAKFAKTLISNDCATDIAIDYLLSSKNGHMALAAAALSGAADANFLRESMFCMVSPAIVRESDVNWNVVAATLNDMDAFQHLVLHGSFSPSTLRQDQDASAMRLALHITAGEFPPKKKKDEDGKDDANDSDGKDSDGDGSDTDAGSTPDEGSASSAPPVGDPVPPAEDQGANGADPQNPTKDAPPVEQDPSMQDPNAVQDPNAQAPISTDPMDRAQATLEAQVEAANQLGHDAMETAYDVDELFSEWRCMNCEQEGRADISEDGQVAFSGDLLEQPQGCTAPVMGGQVPPVDPSQQAPATNGEVPAQDQEVTQGVQARKRKFLRNPFRRSAADDRPDMQSHNEPDEVAPPVSQTQEMALGEQAVEQPTTIESKIKDMTLDILTTNPGMDVQAARKIAVDTIKRFPSVINR